VGQAAALYGAKQKPICHCVLPYLLTRHIDQVAWK